MTIPIWQVDAFCREVFSGNPAAVCVTSFPLPENVMQNIAMENNLSETAFVVEDKNSYSIRWFTPVCEVDLCGHATLAAGHVLFNEIRHVQSKITFNSKSGPLGVSYSGGLLVLDFPSDPVKECTPPQALQDGLNIKPAKCYKGRSDYMFVYEKEEDILNLKPDFAKLKEAECRGLIVTAPGKECDFVSRFFAPQAGIDEDPVTGSAHTTLTPYWSKALNKNKLEAIQLSARRGYLSCTFRGERTEISGIAVTYLRGKIEV